MINRPRPHLGHCLAFRFGLPPPSFSLKYFLVVFLYLLMDVVLSCTLGCWVLSHGIDLVDGEDMIVFCLNEQVSKWLTNN